MSTFNILVELIINNILVESISCLNTNYLQLFSHFESKYENVLEEHDNVILKITDIETNFSIIYGDV